MHVFQRVRVQVQHGADGGAGHEQQQEAGGDGDTGGGGGEGGGEAKDESGEAKGTAPAEERKRHGTFHATAADPDAPRQPTMPDGTRGFQPGVGRGKRMPAPPPK